MREYELTKDETIEGLKILAPVEIKKASRKNGGGLLKIHEDNTYDRVKLLRSKNYKKYQANEFDEDDYVRYDLLSYFKVFTDFDMFNSIMFVIMDSEVLYPLIFKVEDFKRIMDRYGLTDAEDIRMYIQKIDSEDKFVLRRFGSLISEENEYDVSEFYNAWDNL